MPKRTRMSLAKELGPRIRKSRGALTQARFAEIVGISVNTLRGYERGNREPGADAVLRIAQAANVPLVWLLTGKQQEQFPTGVPQDGASRGVLHEGRVSSRQASRRVPVLAFAARDPSGWHEDGLLTLPIPTPFPHLYSPELVAVCAKGQGMAPDGIRDGHIVFCDPLKAPKKDDAVYIVRQDGSMAIKRYLGQDGAFLRIQWWLDPDESGAQLPHVERLAVSDVARVAPVTIVVRDLWNA